MDHKKYPLIEKPYIYPLSLDYIDLNNAYIIDDGFYLTLVIGSEVNQLLVYEVRLNKLRILDMITLNN